MVRIFATLILALAVSVPALADVTIKQTTSGKGMGMSGKMPGTVYIKGNRMRSDTLMGDKTQTIIFDLDERKMFTFDSKKKEAEAWDMSTLGAEISKNVDVSSAGASFKPNGQTKQISGRTATGYDMAISMDGAIGGSQDMKLTVTMSGPVWMVKDAPGAEDYSRFYRTAAEKGWIFSDPRVAKAQPGQAKAMAEMYKQMADVGGIAYEIDMQMKMGGSGPMAGIFAKMGNMSMLTVVDSVETGALGDEIFAPPAGYKVNSKK